MLLYWQIAAGVFEWTSGWKIALIVINAVALAALLAAVIGVAVSRRRAFRKAEIRAEEAAGEAEETVLMLPAAELPEEPVCAAERYTEPDAEISAEERPAEEIAADSAGRQCEERAEWENLAAFAGQGESAAPAALPLILPGVGEGTDYRSGKRRNLSFEDKMAAAEPEMREMYAALKAELLSYADVKSRLSHSWDTFKFKKKKVVAKFSMAGKRLVVHLALDPAAYPDAKFPVEDKGGIALYEDTPMAVKVRGASTFKFVKRLLADLAAREGMQGKGGAAKAENN